MFKPADCELVLFDACNTIHKAPQLHGYVNKPHDTARKALANLVATWRHQVGYGGKITIVFDGQAQGGDQSTTICGVHCIFTRTMKDADTKIIEIVRSHHRASKVAVVSNDNNVKNNIRPHGARSVEPSSFFEQRQVVHVKDDGHRGLTADQIRETNDFLTKAFGL